MTEKEQKKREKDRRANRTILWRTMFLMFLFGVAIFVPMLGKLWEIQIVKHEYYQELAVKQQTSDLEVSANRGVIYDANGNILSISATVHNVVVSPRDVVELQKNYAEAVKKAEEGKGEYPDYPAPTNEFIAAGLSEILGVDQEVILERLAKVDRAYEVIKTKVEEDVMNQVLEFRTENKLAGGIVLEPATKRYYPYASLAAHVIGFVNDNGGAYGLEAKYEEELSGEAGRVITSKTGRGTEMPSRYESYVNSVDGEDLHLTLDVKIQAMLESTLAEGIETYDVRYGGFAIAMDPNTGAILGMASSPEYDLNNYSAITDPTLAAQLEELKNDPAVTEEEYSKAVQNARSEQWSSKTWNWTYEPGSTFKCLVVAAALEEGVVSLSDTFTCTGQVTVGGSTIRCHKHEGHGTQTLAEAVSNSCNPAFIAIGQRLGAEKFYDYLERYNVVGMTGIDLPNEDNNNDGVRVWTREFFTSEIGISSLATASFGQRFQLTPIQLINAVSSVVNGGHLMEPYVVDSIVDSDGNLVYQHQPTEVRQVISQATSEQVRTILEGVVDGGGGKNAYMAGYRIGGKTGTSETNEKDHNIVSFVGFAPADDPQVVLLLAFDGPTPGVSGSFYTAAGHYISGGQMAAVMAGPLMASILDYMGVQKHYTAEELSAADVLVPSLAGRTLDNAKAVLAESGLTYRTVGEGDTVTGQIPIAGASIPGNSQVVLYMGEQPPTEQVAVPKVVGLTPSEAQTALTNAGLYIRATGAVEYYSSNDKAVTQSIAEGTMVNLGTVVEVRFVDGSVIDYTGSVFD